MQRDKKTNRAGSHASTLEAIARRDMDLKEASRLEALAATRSRKVEDIGTEHVKHARLLVRAADLRLSAGDVTNAYEDARKAHEYTRTSVALSRKERDDIENLYDTVRAKMARYRRRVSERMLYVAVILAFGGTAVFYEVTGAVTRPGPIRGVEEAALGFTTILVALAWLALLRMRKR